MPRKAKAEPKLSQKELKKQAKWGGYIECDLGADERKEFDLWVTSTKPDVAALLEEVVQAGFTFSAIFDEANSSCVARLYYIVVSEKKGYMLTAFHHTVLEAMELLMFKHYVILNQSWAGEGENAYQKPTWG